MSGVTRSRAWWVCAAVCLCLSSCCLAWWASYNRRSAVSPFTEDDYALVAGDGSDQFCSLTSTRCAYYPGYWACNPGNLCVGRFHQLNDGPYQYDCLPGTTYTCSKYVNGFCSWEILWHCTLNYGGFCTIGDQDGDGYALNAWTGCSNY